MEKKEYKVQRPRGPLANEPAIEDELRAWVAEHGQFPTPAQLMAAGRKDIIGAVNRRGGFPLWRSRMGFEQLRRPSGFYDDPVNIERELREAMARLGRFPRKGDFGKIPILYSQMTRHGGTRYWRRLVGVEEGHRPNRYMDDEANIEAELRAWVSKHGRFPRKDDRSDKAPMLFRAMGKHRGRSYWRKLIGFKPVRRPIGSLSDLEGIECELRSWITTHGKFPTQRELGRTQSHALSSALDRTGGLTFWAERTGYTLPRHARGYWNATTVESNLLTWIEARGHFPTAADLARDSKNGLLLAIGKNGGLPVWRAKLGYGPITPEALREHADVLARVVLTLGVTDTAAFWDVLQKRWTMNELTEAIREFAEEGKLDRFRTLLAAG